MGFNYFIFIMAYIYNATFSGNIVLDPHDFLECRSEDELNDEIELAIIEETGINSEYLDEWDVQEEFLDEWRTLKEENLREMEYEYDENN